MRLGSALEEDMRKAVPWFRHRLGNDMERKGILNSFLYVSHVVSDGLRESSHSTYIVSSADGFVGTSLAAAPTSASAVKVHALECKALSGESLVASREFAEKFGQYVEVTITEATTDGERGFALAAFGNKGYFLQVLHHLAATHFTSALYVHADAFDSHFVRVVRIEEVDEQLLQAYRGALAFLGAQHLAFTFNASIPVPEIRHEKVPVTAREMHFALSKRRAIRELIAEHGTILPRQGLHPRHRANVEQV